MREALEKSFPEGYWKQWEAQFGHNFFDSHFARTLEYHSDMGEDLRGKAVLEVGSYPGLEAAWLLHIGCRVTALDSPQYNPDYWQEWLKSKGLNQIVHDIVQGAPEIDGRWDAAVMSDVLLHVDGFPIEFFKWLLKSCDKVYLLNYPGGDMQMVPAKGHTLERGHTITGKQHIIALAESCGKSLLKTLTTGGRELLVFGAKL